MTRKSAVRRWNKRVQNGIVSKHDTVMEHYIYSGVMHFDGDTKGGIMNPLERMFDSECNADVIYRSFKGLDDYLPLGDYLVTISILSVNKVQG